MVRNSELRSRRAVLLANLLVVFAVAFTPGVALGAEQQSVGVSNAEQPNATCPADGQCFADVLPGTPFYEFINRIYQQDLVTGYPCGGPGEPCDAENRPYYRPGSEVTRQQMAKFIDNARRLPGIHIEADDVNVRPISASNTTGIAISASSMTGQALSAVSTSGTGIYSQSGGQNASALSAYSTGLNGFGLNATTTASSGGEAVRGAANCATCYGVRGNNPAGVGVYGTTNVSWGVMGVNTASNGSEVGGVLGVADCNFCSGVQGESAEGYGVSGYSAADGRGGVLGLNGGSAGGSGVNGQSDCDTCAGVRGNSTSGIAVVGYGQNYRAIYGYTYGDIAIHGKAMDPSSYGGYFEGNVQVTGNVSKGGGSFKIDHPLDPENKYLYHSFVESPDMMNIYNGNVTTDSTGEAVVTLPDWFEALNKDFRYQLTVLGEEFAQARISSKVKDSTFTIKTDKPNIEVSWQVTGIRQDDYANAHRIPVEEVKSPEEQGKYLYAAEAGQPDSKRINMDPPGLDLEPVK